MSNMGPAGTNIRVIEMVWGGEYFSLATTGNKTRTAESTSPRPPRPVVVRQMRDSSRSERNK